LTRFALQIRLSTTYLSILVFMSRPRLHIHTPPLFQVKLEKDDWGR